jgi:RNA polymerase sigma factor for flagellar operon FliA
MDQVVGLDQVVGVDHVSATPMGGISLSPDQVSELDCVVRALAGRLRARLPYSSGIEMSDLVQAGNLGLLQAARSFEPGKGAPLACYAKYRIRGEMLDMVRRNMGSRQSPSGRVAEGEEFSDWESRIPAHPDCSPQAGLLGRQRMTIISEEIERLPKKYQVVVRMRYSCEMTLRQIGSVLRVNESRACQIHRLALNRLKRALSSRGVKHMSHL